jgi:deoxycytidylate deaminase
MRSLKKKAQRKSSLPEYPYLPEGRTINYVPINNIWMQAARTVSETQSGCSWWQTGAVVVSNGKIIGQGANHSSGTITIPCPRHQQGSKTGEDYHLCREICKSKDEAHAEFNAVVDAQKNGHPVDGADLFLFGHWWCCERCWDEMIDAGVNNVYLLQDAHKIFTKEKRNLLMKSFKNMGEGHTIQRSDIKWDV